MSVRFGMEMSWELHYVQGEERKFGFTRGPAAAESGETKGCEEKGGAWLAGEWKGLGECVKSTGKTNGTRESLEKPPSSPTTDFLSLTRQPVLGSGCGPELEELDNGEPYIR